MLNVQLICVGKLKETFYAEAAAEYAKRLSAHCQLTLTELPEERLPKNPSPAQITRALEKEAAAILGKLPKKSILTALCVEGKLCSSEELAQSFAAWANRPDGGGPVFVVGGSHGLHPDLKARAAHRLSMSPMTFPHHLARVMLLEQVYRAFQINEGSSYHK